MALTSSSTFTQVESEFKDTASYRINQSASEARRHAVAIEFLLLLLPSSATKGANQVGYDMGLLAAKQDRAYAYADSIDGGITRKNNRVQADFRTMRTNG